MRLSQIEASITAFFASETGKLILMVSSVLLFCWLFSRSMQGRQ